MNRTLYFDSEVRVSFKEKYEQWISEAAQAMELDAFYKEIEPARSRFWYIQTFKCIVRALEVSDATILEAAIDAYNQWKDKK